MENGRTYTAFAGVRRVATGDLRAAVREIKARLDGGEPDPILVFEDETGEQVDFDLSGTPEEVLARLPSHPLFATGEPEAKPRTGPGRPKLGVVCREVSLLPRHWEWLERQPGGISVAMRKLVEEARKRGQGKELARRARDAAGKFMWTMAGNLPDFEEASRALFAGDHAGLEDRIHGWPEDIRNHLERLVKEYARLEQEAKTEEATV